MTTQAKSKPRSVAKRDMMPEPRRFTFDEYSHMWGADVFHPEERLELIDGEILIMPAIGPEHGYGVGSAMTWFAVRVEGRAVVRCQDALHLSDRWAPEPDLMLLLPPKDRYRTRLPEPEDVLLVIEVAQTSLAFDRNVKLAGYAAANVPEVWIVDLNGGQVFTYREPKDGSYAVTRAHGRGESLSPLKFPDLQLPVDEVLS